MAATSIIEIGNGGDAAAVAAAIAAIVDAIPQYVNAVWDVRVPTGDLVSVYDSEEPVDGYQVDALVWRAGGADASDVAGRELYDTLASKTAWRLRLRDSSDEILLTHQPSAVS